MKRFAPLVVLLAWTLLQVPLVVCESECDSSVSLALLSGGHGCHAKDSEEHRTRCCPGHGDHERSSHPRDEAPADTNPDEAPGEHSVLLVPLLSVGEAVTIPSPSASDWNGSTPERVSLFPAKVESSARVGEQPPVPPDPVDRADILLL